MSLKPFGCSCLVFRGTALPPPSQTLLDPISDNNLATLTSAIQSTSTPLQPVLNLLLGHAVAHNAINTIPYLVSLGACPLSDPTYDHLYKSTNRPSFKCLIECGLLDINTDLEPLGTFLLLAAQHNDPSHVEYCLQHGADPNQGTYAFRWSALATAVEYNAGLDVLDLLIAGGADVNGSDALHTAAEQGRIEMLKFLLIEKGADVNTVGFEYCLSDSKALEAGPALHFAVDGDHVEAVRILIENGADVTLRDVQGRTALERAIEKEKDEVRLYLDKAGSKSLSDGEMAV